MKFFALLLLAVLALASANERVLMPLMPRISVNPQNTPLKTLIPASPQIKRPVVPGTKLVAQCGIATDTGADSKIVGGTDVGTVHKYPWQCFLTIDNAYLCGGSLISDTWVLSAAHCTTGAGSIEVLMGAYDKRQNEASQVTMIATKIITHEDYGPIFLVNDIGLINLPQSVAYTTAILPICLPAYSAAVIGAGVMLTASGWGITADGNALTSNTLNEMTQPSISNSECADLYGDTTINSGTICTSAVNGTGTCSGDSGGPLMFVDTDGKTYSRGVTSFVSSDGCESGNPDGFTRTLNFVGWIETNTDIAIDP